MTSSLSMRSVVLLLSAAATACASGPAPMHANVTSLKEAPNDSESEAPAQTVEVDNPNATGLPLVSTQASTATEPATSRPPRSHRQPICAGPGSKPAAPAKAACCYPDHTAMRKLIQSRNEAYRKCYEAALVRDEKLEGRFDSAFTVDKDGIVRRACETRNEASPDGIDDPEMVRCLVNELTQLKFPALDDVCPTMRINYPMSFKPS